MYVYLQSERRKKDIFFFLWSMPNNIVDMRGIGLTNGEVPQADTRESSPLQHTSSAATGQLRDDQP